MVIMCLPENQIGHAEDKGRSPDSHDNSGSPPWVSVLLGPHRVKSGKITVNADGREEEHRRKHAQRQGAVEDFAQDGSKGPVVVLKVGDAHKWQNQRRNKIGENEMKKQESIDSPFHLELQHPKREAVADGTNYK